MRICWILTACLSLMPMVASAQSTAAKEQLKFESDLLAIDVQSFDQSCAKRLMARDDSDKDGILNEQEFEKLKLLAKPTQFDINNNGRITQLELAIYFANCRQQLSIDAYCCADARKLTESHDRNADWAISEIEYRAIPCSLTFGQLDWDADQHVDQFEFAKWLAREFVDNGIHPDDHFMAIAYVQRLDQDADQLLSVDEQARGDWPEDLSQYDADKDGKADSSDIAMLLTDFKARTGVDYLAQAGAGRAMKRYDKNRDGRLDETEITNGKYPKNWETFDFNGDGHLTWYELAERYVMNRVDRGTTVDDLNQADKLIRRYDRNRNWSIDMSEVLETRADIGEITLEEMAEYDTDGNQKLSKQELSIFFAKQRHSDP